MHDLNNAAKADENSGLDNTPPNSDFEVNMIIKEIEGEILLQVRTVLLACGPLLYAYVLYFACAT